MATNDRIASQLAKGFGSSTINAQQASAIGGLAMKFMSGMQGGQQSMSTTVNYGTEVGTPILKFVTPANTSYATLITAATAGFNQIKHFIIAANATGASYTVAINDGTDTWEVATAVPLAADSHVWTWVPPFDLPESHSLMVKVDVADNVTFTANGRFVARAQ